MAKSPTCGRMLAVDTVCDGQNAWYSVTHTLLVHTPPNQVIAKGFRIVPPLAQLKRLLELIQSSCLRLPTFYLSLSAFWLGHMGLALKGWGGVLSVSRGNQPKRQCLACGCPSKSHPKTSTSCPYKLPLDTPSLGPTETQPVGSQSAQPTPKCIHREPGWTRPRRRRTTPESQSKPG